MRKFLFALFLSQYSILNTQYLFSQNCPVCTIDLTCDSVPAAPKLCPAELPEDTAGQYYSANLTFYIPKQFNDPQYGTVDLNQIDVLGVTGLPAGMSWAAYNYQGVAATSFFPPSNPPASERGCAKICGTPPMPFDDSITVSVLAYVTVSGVNATQNTSFKVHLKIVPNPSGNSVFTMDNSQACDSISVNFTPNLASNGDPMITYDWNFGNGNTSTNENVSQTYTMPGDYAVKCTTTVYQYVITSLYISALNNNWCGDVEEWFCSTNNPDPFFQVYNLGALIYNSDTVWNQKTNISYPGMSIPVEGNQFTVYFFDADDGPPFGSVTDSLGYTTFNVSGNGGTYNFSTPSPYSGTNGNLTVVKQVKDIYIDSDYVHIYAPPVLSLVSVSPSSTLCGGDSAILSINGGFSGYQWYRDTLLLNGENDSSLTTMQSGNYWVQVTNSFGCSKTSNVQNITVLSLPFAAISANGPTTFCEGASLTLTSVSASSYLWSTGATLQSIIVNSSGNYWVKISNASGCSDTSVVIAVTVKPNPTATISANGNTTFCEGDSVILSANTADFYLWNNGYATQNISVFTSGSYTVTTTNANGCSTTSSPMVVVVNDNPSPEISLSGSTVFCSGDTAFLHATSAVSYLWNTGENTQNIPIAASGNFSVTVMDANGCSGTDSISISGSEPPEISATVVNASAPGICDGAATTAISGGLSPYFYFWSNNQTSETDTGLCAGTYSITVSDANNCSSTEDVVVLETPAGIEERNEELIASIFPNPASGNFTIVFEGISATGAQIKIFNVFGESVYAYILNDKKGNYHEINPGNIPPGIYFVQLKIGNKILNKKLLIQY